MPRKRATRLAEVTKEAIKSEAFLKKLMKDPERAVEDAGLQLSDHDLKRLKKALRRPVTVDVPSAIRLIRKKDRDPWPMGWTP